MVQWAVGSNDYLSDNYYFYGDIRTWTKKHAQNTTAGGIQTLISSSSYSLV